ncbi:MAG TPA: RNA polymerase sigma factor [Bacteroidales bacterium]|nr:RNA polymerase sigma factor [Bacteroidales bacterium]
MEKDLQRKSVDKFFRKEYNNLVNAARSQMDSRYIDASPEDIVQDVALGLLERLNPETQIRNLAGYIYRSVRNRILDFQRKKQRNVSLERFRDDKTGNSLSNTLTDQATADEAPYERVDPETLREAISRLRPDEQAILLATVFEERTYEELSEEWDIPVGTLLSRKHRALSKLYKILNT